jgi:hypothetical protein
MNSGTPAGVRHLASQLRTNRWQRLGRDWKCRHPRASYVSIDAFACEWLVPPPAFRLFVSPNYSSARETRHQSTVLDTPKQIRCLDAPRLATSAGLVKLSKIVSRSLAGLLSRCRPIRHLDRHGRCRSQKSNSSACCFLNAPDYFQGQQTKIPVTRTKN